MSDEPIPETEDDAALQQQMSDAADKLSEFCDSVVIIATLRSGGGTSAKYSTRGNCYASEGAVRAWLKSTREGKGSL